MLFNSNGRYTSETKSRCYSTNGNVQKNWKICTSRNKGNLAQTWSYLDSLRFLRLPSHFGLNPLGCLSTAGCLWQLDPIIIQVEADQRARSRCSLLPCQLARDWKCIAQVVPLANKTKIKTTTLQLAHHFCSLCKTGFPNRLWKIFSQLNWNWKQFLWCYFN